ncbi:hypothetical protein [Photorhabdus africana]|uniref:hypothetical protein n=1 Tax=Photorhabdus africana TaxID=3097554 RepID=UPI002B40C4D4|nr:hypothetical protein [Photorhabdus sp. CRI-LC]
MLPGIHSLAVAMHLEIHWVYTNEELHHRGVDAGEVSIGIFFTRANIVNGSRCQLIHLKERQSEL